MKRKIGFILFVVGFTVLSGVSLGSGETHKSRREMRKAPIRIILRFGKEIFTSPRRSQQRPSSRVLVRVKPIPHPEVYKVYRSSAELSVKAKTGSRREVKIASRVNLKPASLVPKDSEMVLIPEGEFLMGSSEKDIDEAMKLCEESRRVAPNVQCDRVDYKDEMPQHKVRLDAFYIDKYLVTNRQFMKFVEATGYKTDAEKDRIGLIVRWAGNYEGEIITKEDGSVNWRSPFGRKNEINHLLDHPVVQVSWNDAVAYCQWAGKRLPTEAEWEKAARGTDGRLFPWGNELPDAGGKYRANYGKDRGRADGFEYTSPVGSFPQGASPYGVMDMAGNVWEWVADWYDETYYATSPAENPQGPASGKGRVLRGGSWGNRPESIRTAVRLRSEPNSGISYIGFRCARSY
jgi:formylglycine-generating enzyme required for sulfatase activity